MNVCINSDLRIKYIIKEDEINEMIVYNESEKLELLFNQNPKLAQDESLFINAVKLGKMEVANVFLDHGAPIDWISQEDGGNLLHLIYPR